MDTSAIIIACMVLFVVIFFIIALWATRAAMKHEENIYENGLETDSTVAWIKSHFNGDGAARYSCYVKYIGDDGIEHEGLLNLRTDLPIGRKVRIKYLPGKYNEVVFVSQEL